MNIYKSKYSSLAGTDYGEITRSARKEYNKVQKLTKRQPYVRSVYFKKDKIFITIFWNHLAQKRRGEQMARARLLLVAFDLMRHTAHEPETKNGKNGILLHRFFGVSSDGVLFCVQVKQSKQSSRKDFMSVFPVKNRNKKGLPLGSLETTVPKVLY